jgi:hypothetical protein
MRLNSCCRDNLLRAHDSIVAKLVAAIPEEDWSEVEINRLALPVLHQRPRKTKSSAKS